MNQITELKPPLILEVETEDFVAIISSLTCQGYRVVARIDNPSRFRVIDEMPGVGHEPSAA